MNAVKTWHCLVLIAVVVLLSYARILEHDFLNWDDDVYILNNAHITSFSPANLKHLFTEQMMGNYHPMTLLTLAIDYQIGGLQPKPYLFTNLFLHVLNALLVFGLIHGLTARKDIALITALFFGVHPLQVESVAWISERKNVLYALFFLSSLIMYVKYVQQEDVRAYRYALLLFFLSLLSKATAVALVPTLLAVDYYFGRNLQDKRIWREKWPFFALALIFGVIALLAQQAQGATHYSGEYDFLQRIAFASHGYVQYLWKLLLPMNLSAIYPYPDLTGDNMPVHFWIYPVLVILLMGLFFKLRQRSRRAFFGVAFYSINIFLVLQLIPVGAAMMADRYVYLPSIGIFWLIGLLYDRVRTAGVRWERMARAAIAVVVLICAALTIQRSAVWQNSLSLWNDVLGKYPHVFFGYNNRGTAHQAAGDLQAAMADYQRALQIMPNYPSPHYNLAKAKAALGDFRGAVEEMERAIALNPRVAVYYYERAQARMELGEWQTAMADLDSVIRLEPQHSIVWMSRGVIRKRLGDIPGAIVEYDQGLQINPRDANIYYNRGLAHFNLRDMEKAKEDFRATLQLNPGFAEAHFSLGFVFHLTGELPSALECYDQAIRHKPDFGKAFHYRGRIKEALGRNEEGMSDRQQATTLGFVAPK